MSQLQIHAADGRIAFRPGETIEVKADWQLDTPAESIQLRLIWFTAGKGTEDVCVVDDHSIEHPGKAGSHEWQLQLPTQPYSFSGTLISLIWSLELLVDDGDQSTLTDITIAPGGKEIDLLSDK